MLLFIVGLAVIVIGGFSVLAVKRLRRQSQEGDSTAEWNADAAKTRLQDNTTLQL